jgi:hypothetical protein
MWRGVELVRLAAPEAGNPPILEVSALALTYWIDGDSVSIKAVTYRLESTSPTAESLASEDLGAWMLSNALPQGALKTNVVWIATPTPGRFTSKAAGTAVLRLGESAIFPEMARFRLRPLVVKIVPASRSAPPLFAAKSKAPSIQLTILEQLDLVDDGAHAFRLQFRNSSNKAATSVMWCDPCWCGPGPNPLHPLLPGTDWKTVIGSYCHRPTVEVEGALFADGTSEGNLRQVRGTAAPFAGTLAAQSQDRRIRDVVGRILADLGADDAAKAARIRAEISNLPETLNRGTITALRRRIRGLPDAQWTIVANQAALYLHGRKADLLAALAAFERDKPGKSLAEWWNEWSRTL